jgi:hypothetical protein
MQVLDGHPEPRKLVAKSPAGAGIIIDWPSLGNAGNGRVAGADDVQKVRLPPVADAT